MRVAVLGGGHGCYAAAAEMTERGHRVSFWRRNAESFSEVLRTQTISVQDYRGTRRVEIHRATTSLEEAVTDAELILSPLPATAQADLADNVAPLLQSGQVMFIPPGTFGSLLYARAMRRMGNRADVSFAETGTLPNLVRKHGPASIVISAYAKHLPTGVFPARNSEHAFKVLSGAYSCIEPLPDVLSAALMNAGPVIHPPLILMNAGPLEHFPSWDIHNEGTQPSIRSVTTALDGERMAIREALGYRPPHYPLQDHYAAAGSEWMYGRKAHDSLTKSGDWREKIDLLSHRYMIEDTSLGLAFLTSVGRWAGVASPVGDGLLAIASAICGRDFRQSDRSFEKLGLADLNREAMSQLLREGV